MEKKINKQKKRKENKITKYHWIWVPNRFYSTHTFCSFLQVHVNRFHDSTSTSSSSALILGAIWLSFCVSAIKLVNAFSWREVLFWAMFMLEFRLEAVIWFIKWFINPVRIQLFKTNENSWYFRTGFYIFCTQTWS